MKRLIAISLAFLLLGASQTAMAADSIEVMTQNQYLGADLTPVIAALDIPSFIAAATAALTQVGANDFPTRADALAELIANRLPELVGLQEVFNFEVDPDGPGPAPFLNIGPPFVDHLTETLSALAALGETYVPVATVKNLDITLAGFPLPGFPGLVDIRVVDRDVILARADIAGGTVPVAFPCAKPSVDGCNYDAIVSVASPVGPIDIERGWVGVDITLDGKDYRFVDTHLEVRFPDGTPPSQAAQVFQALQLVATLGATTPPGRELIVVGDINSSPDDPSVTGLFGFDTPYFQLIGAGYTDAWDLRPEDVPGFSCCQLSDLSNHQSIHDERIDVIFSAGVPEKVKKARVLGDKVSDKTGPPPDLWPSDHGSVAAQLQFD